MSGLRGPASGGLFPPGVLQQLDKENVTAINVPGRTPDKRRTKPSAGFKVFQDDSATTRPSTSKKERPSSQVINTPRQDVSEVARYKEEARQARRHLDVRNERVQELKATTASANERYTALLKSHEEANKELGLLRTQLASGGAGGGNVERLKASVENLETNNQMLREERKSLEARLAKREAAMLATKNDLTATGRREESLREEVARLRGELEVAARDASEKADATREETSGNVLEAQWTLEKAALGAQVGELEAQLAASGRRCASVAAERAVLVEESTRRESEHSSTIASLQDELQSLHRRTSADLGDWQRRHREAVGAKKAVEGQLERLVGASKSIARVAEKQAVLEASLHEACELLSQAVLAEATEGCSGTESNSTVGASKSGPDSPGRVVEGVLENILGRVVGAARVKEDSASTVEGGGEERRRELETEQELLKEEMAKLGGTLELLAAEMESLREFGAAEAEVFLESAQSLETELDRTRGRHAAVVSDIEAERAQCEQEIELLTRRLGEGDGERKDLELRLESAANELAATVQLSELALAARVSAGEAGRAEEGTRGAAEATQRIEQLEAQSKARREELESERCAYAEKAGALEAENRVLQEKLEGLSAQASALKARAAARDARSPVERTSPRTTVSAEAWAAKETELQNTKSRLTAVVTEKEELEKKIEAGVICGGDQASPRSDDRQAKIAALDAEVTKLRGLVEAEKERVDNAKEADLMMRKYVTYHNERCEQKMKEMQKRLARATGRVAAEDV